MDQELQNQEHVRLVANDEVDVTVLEYESDTLPAVERDFGDLRQRHRIEVFAEHPDA